LSDAFDARVEQEPASADGGAADQSSTEPISILSTLRNCWQRPAWTAERAQHIRLPHAWLVHAMAMLCIFVSPTLLEAGLSQNPPGELKRRVEVILHWIVEAPEQAFVAFGGSALVFEILFLLFALALMTWGARVEPVRRSYRVTLQRVWIQTVHLAIAILSVVVVSVVIDQVFRRPFFLAFSWLEVLSFFMSGIAIAWAYWGFIKAVGAPRDAPQIPVSPTCEGCGYNLTHTSSDERCTECGRPVSESLGEHVRPGLQERAAALLPAAFLKPQRLGERV
jgi:hypothetical protein